MGRDETIRVEKDVCLQTEQRCFDALTKWQFPSTCTSDCAFHFEIAFGWLLLHIL